MGTTNRFSRRDWLLAGLAILVVAALDLIFALPGWVTDASDNPRGPGFVKRVYVDSQGGRHNYTLFVPFELKSESHPPLLMFLNGWGENGSDGVSHLNGPLGIPAWDTKGANPFLMIFPQCRKESHWGAETMDSIWALAILDEVADEYHTDPDRVYLTGASAGGAGVWSNAAAHPERFAAIVPLCGIGIGTDQARKLADAHLPIWSFAVSGDKPELVGAHRGLHNALQAAGTAPRYAELLGVRHDCWSYAYRNPALYEWLLDQTRSANAATNGKFLPLFNGRDFMGWVPPESTRWSVNSDQELECDNESGDVETALTTERDYKNFELVVEFRLTTGFGYKTGLHVTTPIPGPDFDLRAAEFGSGGLREANGMSWIQAVDSMAQRALDAHGWNDFRLLVQGDRVVANLNGQKLLDTPTPAAARGPGKIAFRVPAGGSITWRRVQVREIP